MCYVPFGSSLQEVVDAVVHVMVHVIVVPVTPTHDQHWFPPNPKHCKALNRFGRHPIEGNANERPVARWCTP